jgi:hypothetical protein
MRSAIGKQQTSDLVADQSVSLSQPSPYSGNLSLSFSKPVAAAINGGQSEIPCSSKQEHAACHGCSAAYKLEHHALYGLIQSAVRQAVREEASAASALAASTLARDLQTVVKTAVREALKDELSHMLSSAMAESAAATASAEQRLDDRMAAAVEAVVGRLRSMY